MDWEWKVASFLSFGVGCGMAGRVMKKKGSEISETDRKMEGGWLEEVEIGKKGLCFMYLFCRTFNVFILLGERLVFIGIKLYPLKFYNNHVFWSFLFSQQICILFDNSFQLGDFFM